MADNAQGGSAPTTSDEPQFYGYRERAGDDGLYRVVNGGLPVSEETVAFYASRFPETVYFAAADGLVSSVVHS